MEENKINYRFLNYKQYDNFKADLDEGRILDDSIAFIQDRRRIWARGKEYNCNTDVQIEGNTIRVITSDGELVSTEDFITVDDFNAFMEDYTSQVQESNLTVEQLELKHDNHVRLLVTAIERTVATHNDDMNREINRATTAEETLTTNLNAEIERATTAETNEYNRATTAETNLNNKLDQEIADRVDDVDTEEARAKAAEQSLHNDLNTEIQDRINDVNTEESRAIAAETALNQKLDQEIADRIADVNSEETRATNAETTLNSKLDDEISNRQTAVTNEYNRATAAENTLDSKVNQEIQDRTTAVTNENTRAVAEETRLDNKLNLEISNRQTAVTAEKNRAEAAEEALDDKLDLEIADRRSAVTAEQNRALSVEQAHAQDIQALLSLIEGDHDGTINKFNEITQFLSTISDTSTLSGIVSGISEQISTVEQTLLNTKQDNISAGEGIDITNNIVSVEDYIGERTINAKLKTLLEYLGNLYVLKKDVYQQGLTNWSDTTIYPFGDIPDTSSNITPNHSDIVAVETSVYEQLKRDGSIRNDICYIVYE